MKSIIYHHSLPLTHADAFRIVETATPVPEPHDLLVSIQAVSVNPVDTKIRSGGVPVPDAITTLGWDASGIVKAVGTNVTLFKPGDEVFYAGTFTRQGANSELHLVDERLVGAKPKSLSFVQSAALPLTALTAWELLFDRFGIVPGKTTSKDILLIVGGAGGVGSMLIQIARRLTNMTVIATASRAESREWCLRLGAHHVVNHSQPLAKEVAALNISPITHIAALAHTNRHFSAIAEIIAPQGKIAIIDDHDFLDAVPLKGKSVSLHWEMVFTRPLYQTEDMIAHHQILTEISFLVDIGVLQSTLTKELHPLDVENLKLAHTLVEQGNMLGKVVMSST